MIKPLIFFIIVITTYSNASAGIIVFQEKTEQANINVELITEGLGVVWGMAFLNQDEIIFTERDGKLGIASISSGTVTNLNGVPKVKAEGQGGLLDVATPLDYQTGDWIYLTYSKDQNRKGVTTLARAKVAKGNVTNWEDLLVTKSSSNTGRHYGSRIAFDDQGHIFFTLGDRGDRPSSQDLQQHNGSVLRIKLDGNIPSDNPFFANKNTLPEIWSYGHRNPQGIVFDSHNNRLWLNEHGPRGGDEINLVSPGLNYGWPVISYGKEYWGPLSVGEGTHKEGMEQPKKVYTPSIAPGSLLHYTAKVFPEWTGNLFSGALKLTHINRVVVTKNAEIQGEERLLNDFGERIRSLRQGPDGYIYFSTDSGKILRIVPTEL